MELKDKNLYFVGGVVRDEILGTKNADVDYCYEGDAVVFAQKYNVIKVNPDFGTVKILYNNQDIDIASTRVESYPKKGHLPLVSKIGCSLKEDLKRRDFTINAMAKRTTDGEIFDYFGGVDDIKNGKLKVLHPESFIDDPTRIIRGLKFSVRFDFDWEENTEILKNDYLNNINYDMSYYRLKNELVDAFSLNKQEVYDKFVSENMYKLLSIKCKKPGNNIIFHPEDMNTSYTWLIYLSFFDLSNLPLTKQEKRILEWADKLNYQKKTNNTPIESVIINNIRREYLN